MAKSKGPEATPARPPPSLKKQSSSTSSTKNQTNLLGFFSKMPMNSKTDAGNNDTKVNGSAATVNGTAVSNGIAKKPAFRKSASKNMTPVPSSDAAGPSSSQENENGGIPKEVDATGLLSPSTPAKKLAQESVHGNGLVIGSSPSRKVCNSASRIEVIG